MAYRLRVVCTLRGDMVTQGRMSPLELVNLTPLMECTSGRPDVVIGLLDGPVATIILTSRRITSAGSLSGKAARVRSLPPASAGTGRLAQAF